MDPDWQGSSGTFGPTEQERIRILFSSSASFRNLQGKEGWESGRGKTNAMFGPRFMAIVAQSGQLHLGWGGAGRAAYQTAPWSRRPRLSDAKEAQKPVSWLASGDTGGDAGWGLVGDLQIESRE